ncbi:MAG TPA: N-acetyltransferase, partial [Roseiflexaceae bacterium]|nr:N-acetyltransferase [Roseiflexaceae bacterium]
PWLYGLVVREAYRGRGYGRQIVAAALAEVASQEHGDVFLEVEPENTPAVNLYRSLGFAVVRTFDYWAKELHDGTYS